METNLMLETLNNLTADSKEAETRCAAVVSKAATPSPRVWDEYYATVLRVNAFLKENPTLDGWVKQRYEAGVAAHQPIYAAALRRLRKRMVTWDELWPMFDGIDPDTAFAELRSLGICAFDVVVISKDGRRVEGYRVRPLLRHIERGA